MKTLAVICGLCNRSVRSKDFMEHTQRYCPATQPSHIASPEEREAIRERGRKDLAFGIRNNR